VSDDARWLGAALALAERGVGRTSPNPSVGCVIVADGRVVGRGWTQPGGRPHAEAMALAAAGDAARGATVYVTLEPCAHVSPRGPACSDLLIAAGVVRVVAGGIDPDPRTAGAGFARMRAAGIAVAIVASRAAERLNAGFFLRHREGRPHVTLKLALSLDGCIALADGTSRWITGEAARRHTHLERARCDLIVVGAGTLAADDPALDVRLDGLGDRAPHRGVLSTSLAAIPAGARIGGALLLRDLDDLDPGILTVLVEGGTGVATSLLAADRVDRLLIYRAPMVLGGRRGVGDLGLTDLGAALGRWRLASALTLGPDRVEEYDRIR
jgi:diaminohydroxyphosphoribosylaminopyrimidine deaminase/5-amino-6-(5-phosphoribosylamino)uracil reductase